MLEYRQNNIQVIVRVKPEQGCIKVDECDSTLLLISNKQYNYDHVIPPRASQQDVFTMIGQPLINNALQGYNGCVFAYGQTGSGKTHTLIGNNDGLLPQCLQYIFACSIEDPNVIIKGSYLEIYNEQIFDLLSSSSNSLQIREDPKKGIYVENLNAAVISNYDEAIALLRKGNSTRHIAATKMNSESSRSHAVFLIQYSTSTQQDKCEVHLYSKMYFVDLAGSERQKTAQTEGQRLKETQAINKSLTQLGLVIYAIVEREKGNNKIHIPFRDSKLTTLLKDSLGGNSKTFMVAAVNPLHEEESISTLKFAERVKQIKVKAHVNKEYSGEEITKLNLQIQQLKEELVKKTRELENVQPSDALQSQLHMQFDEIQKLLQQIHQSAIQMELETVEGQLQEYAEKKSYIIQILKSLNLSFKEEETTNYQTLNENIEYQNKLKIQLLQQEDVIYKLQKKKKELEQSISDQQQAHKTILASTLRGFEDQIKMKDYLYDQIKEDFDQMEVSKLSLQHQYDVLKEEVQQYVEKIEQMQIQLFQNQQNQSTIYEEKNQNIQKLDQDLQKQIEYNSQLRLQLEQIHVEIYQNNQSFQTETNQLHSQIEQQQLEINRLQECVQKLEVENMNIKQNNDFKREYDQLTQQYSNLKNQYQHLEQEVKSLQTENQYNLSVIENLEISIKSFELFEDNWKQENQLYRNTILELQEQLNQKQEIFLHIQKSFKLDNCENIINELNNKTNQLHRNEQKLRQEISQLKSEQQLYIQKLQIRDQTISDLQNELQDLQKTHRTSEVQKQIEQNEKTQSQRQLEQKIATLKLEYEKINKSKNALLVEYTKLENNQKEFESFLIILEKKLQDYISNTFRKNRVMSQEQQILYLKTTQINQTQQIGKLEPFPRLELIDQCFVLIKFNEQYQIFSIISINIYILYIKNQKRKVNVMKNIISIIKYQFTKKKIIGLGSPLLDIQAEVQLEFLEKYGLKLNNTYFAEQKHLELYEELIKIPSHSHVPGGSALNTIRIARWMAQAQKDQVKFIGCVGKQDKFAKMLIETTNKDGVTALFDEQSYPTGKCAVLLCNKDRCLVPQIGASAHLSKEFVEQHIEEIKTAAVLFCEVYFLYPRAELTKNVFKVAQESNVHTCLSLSSVNAVNDRFNEILAVLPYVDYLFGNEEEVGQFGKNFGCRGGLQESMQRIAEFSKVGVKDRVVVCTQGHKPTLIAKKNELLNIQVESVDVQKIVDTNSAGDSFCGGFIAELLNGADLIKCTKAGNYSAAQTIQHEGSTIPKYQPDKKW
ncbi:unnamed protein product [Paramecium primaurelia]|uniref:Kinesin motor domain-containing protein n=1 Tax=Paramecium primaurelia TaxID=5886 RepID=A0A8S1PQJ7_PARPR|nr:unnamed protein product [Paramecium primaurelia]